MTQTQDFLVCLRNRDFDGLGEWLETLLELTKDDAVRAKTGKMRYDGILLVPLLQSGNKDASKALLGNPKVRSAMQSKDVEHDDWILDLVQNDPFSWLWALEQGWGELVNPAPSVLKGMTIMRARDVIEEYLNDSKKVQADNTDIDGGKRAWDSWLRLASKRNPWLVANMFFPLHDELIQVVQCKQNVSLRPHFWQALDLVYPGAKAIRELDQTTYEGLGIPYSFAEDKVSLGKAIGFTPTVTESISVEFEPGM